MIELSARRYAEAVPAAETPPRAGGKAFQTLLLMVGRGSNEAEANAEFARFARLRWERDPVDWLETCFVALARPTLDEGLRVAAALPCERIVVQPHLIFSGELLQGIRAAVVEAQVRFPERQWVVTEHLGADELLVRALLSRAGLEGSNGKHSSSPISRQTGSEPRSAAGAMLDHYLVKRADLALPEPSV